MKKLLLGLVFVTSASACAAAAPPPPAAPAHLVRDAAPSPAVGVAPLLGAEASAPSPESVPVTDASFAIALKTPAPDGSARVLYDGETLRSGDEFWIELRVFEPIHIYVMWLSPRGEVVDLRPDERDLLVAPGATRRLPADPSESFQLDTSPGIEKLLIVGSRSPLSVGDPNLARVVERIRRGAAAQAAPDRPSAAAAAKPATMVGAPRRSEAVAAAPPESPSPTPAPEGGSAPTRFEDAFDQRYRGIHVVKNGGDFSLQAGVDTKGICVLPFAIHHQP
jgi:hypothetical protein